MITIIFRCPEFSLYTRAITPLHCFRASSMKNGIIEVSQSHAERRRHISGGMPSLPDARGMPSAMPKKDIKTLLAQY
jgi:hypothetical protein